MFLQWLPWVHLSAGDYEAWVSPSAGGRLGRLVWHGPNGDLELVVPVDAAQPFDEDLWPKQGAFAMLPYANRLKGATLWWKDTAHRVRAVAGQVHGLHGIGHRRAWQAGECTASTVRLSWQHAADGAEWPWSFTAALDYALSASGLDVALSIRNDATTSMPAVLGWHPYVPAYWGPAGPLGRAASAVHVVDIDGRCHPVPQDRTPAAEQAALCLHTPHTLALQDWNSTWSMQASTGERWCMSANAAHLVHHVPNDLAYACIEPVTALPGALGAWRDGNAQEADMGLLPGAWRHLNCRLMVASQIADPLR